MNFSKPLNVSSIEISQTNNFSTSIVTFSATSSGTTGSLSIFTIPSNVYIINIQATGASGGNSFNGSSSVPGGNGAVVNSFFRVTPGSNLAVLVGQQGQLGTGGGGGGGSFVWFGSNFNDISSQFHIQKNLLVAAGGGGGSSSFAIGEDANTTTSGTIDNTHHSTCKPGQNGYGGGSNGLGGGGAGILTKGANAKGEGVLLSLRVQTVVEELLVVVTEAWAVVEVAVQHLVEVVVATQVAVVVARLRFHLLEEVVVVLSSQVFMLLK